MDGALEPVVPRNHGPGAKKGAFRGPAAPGRPCGPSQDASERERRSAQPPSSVAGSTSIMFRPTMEVQSVELQ